MDSKLHGLPPHKRFRLIHQQQKLRSDQLIMAAPLRLPAKKRKETRDPPHLLPNSSAGAGDSAYFLPAKKRVWALPPDLLLEKRVSSFDLNAEYNPAFEEEDLVVKHEENRDFKNVPLLREGEVVGGMGEAENGGGSKITEKKEGEIEGYCLEEDDGIVCAVCQSTDGDPSDPIVLCDGCDLMVHASCYGDPLVKGIPDGDWFCAQCSASKGSQNDVSFSCCLCPTKGGAMKPMSGGKWAHVVCALFVPEVFFHDPEGREGIDCSKVPKSRWEQRCYLCKQTNGCAITCSEPKCPLSFHVTCGLNEDLCLEYREETKKKGAIVAGFCKSHTDLWKKQQQTGKYKIVAREE
ncbi:uncharacterized protein LOC133798773 [Humulus lupulus]|uniref:uncharacterized protein LOC133798773 n=1 Tax=Humulus lupulus TaxID=3486 RepID=UPI002B4174CB|nr:uncharacterized protein LOC133798773 [Humulus lupulus]